MRSKIVSAITVLLLFGFPANAEPTIKVINFSAQWCPLCRVLDPRLEDAVDRFSDRGAVLVQLDMTHLTRSEDNGQAELEARLQALTVTHGAGYLWEWYGGHAGVAVIIAADNGEPLTCITQALDTTEIEDRLQESLLLATKVSAGHRRPEGTDCPAPRPRRGLEAISP